MFRSIPRSGLSPLDFEVRAGASVFLHQAFHCCSYAGLITSKIHDYLVLNGYDVVDDPGHAEVQVINTCGYNDAQARLACHAIATVREVSPSAAVVVTGCLTKIDPASVCAALGDAKRQAVLGPRELGVLDSIFEHGRTAFAHTPTHVHNKRYDHATPRDGLYQIIVNLGCLGECRYCAIRRATQRPVSLPLEQVVAEVRRGAAAGHRDFFLSGTDLSCYGVDIGLTFVDLVRSVTQIDLECLFTLESLTPTGLLAHLEELLPIFATGKIALISLPMQSGSQRVLGRMRRPYAVRAVVDAIHRLKQAAPDVLIETDFIYGYADESWDEFMASVTLSRLFDYTYFNEYEPRPGTPALQLSDEQMQARRRVVQGEMKRQSSPLELLSRSRIVPHAAPANGDDSLRRWIEKSAGAFRRIIAQRGAIALGAGWVVSDVDTDDLFGAVVLGARHTTGATLKWALTPPGAPVVYLAASERFQISWVGRPESGTPLEALREQAWSGLLRQLEAVPKAPPQHPGAVPKAPPQRPALGPKVQVP